jgi:nucleoside-diphosphate-sugar epimerase
MSGAILITGATGFLGMEMLAQLLERTDEEIVLMVRAPDARAAQARLHETLGRLFDRPGDIGRRVSAISGDLLERGLGISAQDRRRVQGSVERVIHCAASISFEMPLEQARAINVAGSARVIELASSIAGGGNLAGVVHVSTAYVGGLREGSFSELDPGPGQTFRNTYEHSKCEAEQLWREADLGAVIARPSIVVGHRASGWTPAFNVIYWPMRAAERGLLREIPGRPDSIVDFVPVDYVAEGVLGLLNDVDAHGTYHLVAGAEALTVGELADLHAGVTGHPPMRFATASGQSELAANAYSPYFDVRCRFDDSRMRAVLARVGIQKPLPREYLGQLLAYAHATRWGKHPLTRQSAIARDAFAQR